MQCDNGNVHCANKYVFSKGDFVEVAVYMDIMTSSECYWILNQQLTDTRKSAGPDQGQTSSLKFKK